MAKKLNAKQQKKLDTLKAFIEYAHENYHEDCGVTIGNTDITNGTVLYDIKFNRLGVRIQVLDWMTYGKKWETIENADLSKLYYKAYHNDASFVHYLSLHSDEDLSSHYNKVLQKEQDGID